MRRFLGWAVLALLAVAAGALLWLYQSRVALRAEPVRGDVHVLVGRGGNVGVLGTERGAVVVDTLGLRMQGEAVRERVEALTGREVQLVLNTHYHRDHTRGNLGFPLQTSIVATERTRAHLLRWDVEAFSGEATGALPNRLVKKSQRFELGGKTILALHPGRGHTDGDLVVLFEEDGVLHTGDLFFHRHYPFVDLEAGGSIPAWIESLERVLALDFERVIPGHGEPGDRADLAQFQRFLRELWREVEEAAQAGLSLEQTLDRVELREAEGYAPLGLPGLQRADRESIIRQAFEEAVQRASKGASGAPGQGGAG